MQIDFYVMEKMGRMQALRELCLLLEKPYADGEKVYIHTGSKEAAEQLDKLLWTYRDDSFLAHEIKETSETNAPILIGISEIPQQTSGVLVNLSTEIPSFYQQFNRVIEIVFEEPAVQQAARERFRQYREQGCELNTHKMKVN
ncbi:MAG TPA: DNA polymerase III subunit chi [Gammaproteobacteria bacterium]|jgi:DNA polymerase-3 subunit chi|nr:DNA polymerase III subunit chi [Gammaproteobacteria bacterium]